MRLIKYLPFQKTLTTVAVNFLMRLQYIHIISDR